MLVDDVKIIISAGHGGPGKVSFGKLFSGPDGGNGGKGGDVYVRATTDLHGLNRYSKDKRLSAQDGAPGGKNRSHGKNGDDLEITMPVGTSLTDEATGEVWEITLPDQYFLFCKGGLGGKGNLEFKSGRNISPHYAQPGLPGVSRHLRVVLKYLAEYGLVGLPNSGKSSLLNELTNANAQVADYPFTTLEANLGVINGKVVADIPGLIEGASEGKGLGIKFLKHIEKVRTLLHCIAADSGDLLGDYDTVVKELKSFDTKLVEKPKIILLTKTDLVDDSCRKDSLEKLSKLGFPVMPVSIHDWESISKLKKVFSKHLR